MRQAALFADKNFLYSGDNLRVLRHRIPDEFVDLIYLDPPFNSKQDYNLLFKERTGRRATAQIKAFTDTWKWDAAAAAAYRDTIQNGPEHVSRAMQAFRELIGESDMLAYLSMMAPRLVELHRVLKPTGSLYLHCDPTAEAYLKVLLDSIFDPGRFRNMIIWRRTSAHNDPRRYGKNIDVLLFYAKGDKPTWNQQFTPHDEDYIKRFRNKDPDGRRWSDYDLTAKGLSGGGYEYVYKGVFNLWRVPLRTMKKLDAAGRLHFTSRGGIRIKRYLDENKGAPLQALWQDIPPINSQAGERLGYPTQKPEALLERLILTSSNKGETVLDPFCGCGTAIDVAHRLGRRWIGIDITDLAIGIIENRLDEAYGESVKKTYEHIFDPASGDDARRLAKADPYKFQWWVLDRVGAQKAPHKKGGDKGIDGRLHFQDSERGSAKKILISVKGGSTGPAHVRDLRGVMEREKAAIGVLVTVKEPTRQMRAEAASAGTYHSKNWNQDYPRIQILSIDSILEGRNIDYPSAEWLYKRPLVPVEAEKASPKREKNEPKKAAAASKARGARSVQASK